MAETWPIPLISAVPFLGLFGALGAGRCGAAARRGQGPGHLAHRDEAGGGRVRQSMTKAACSILRTRMQDPDVYVVFGPPSLARSCPQHIKCNLVQCSLMQRVARGVPDNVKPITQRRCAQCEV